jgi:hypothetical protein
MITYKNIAYTLLSKNVTSQSMRTKGALYSYGVVNSFLEQEAKDIIVRSGRLQFVLWEDGPKNVANALDLINLTKKRYGNPLAGGTLRTSETSPATWLRAVYSWDVDRDNIDDVLVYLDEQSLALSELSNQGGPAVYVSIEYRFNLKDVSIEEDERQSSIVAYVSPSSNSLDMHLVFPDFQSEVDFYNYRDKIQKTFPVKMKDKYFSQLITRKNGNKAYVKLY